MYIVQPESTSNPTAVTAKNDLPTRTLWAATEARRPNQGPSQSSYTLLYQHTLADAASLILQPLAKVGGLCRWNLGWARRGTATATRTVVQRTQHTHRPVRHVGSFHLR